MKKEQTATERTTRPDPAGDEVDAVNDSKALEEMAWHLVTELVRKKYTEDRIVAVFKNPLAGSANALYKAKGDRWLRALIASVRRSSAGQPARPAKATGS